MNLNEEEMNQTKELIRNDQAMNLNEEEVNQTKELIRDDQAMNLKGGFKMIDVLEEQELILVLVLIMKVVVRRWRDLCHCPY
jgi:hypothetical protein